MSKPESASHLLASQAQLSKAKACTFDFGDHLQDKAKALAPHSQLWTCSGAVLKMILIIN